MNPILRRTLKAYRPLYLRGLLMDGQYRLPAVRPPEDPAQPAPARHSRGRMLLAALAGLCHTFFNTKSKS